MKPENGHLEPSDGGQDSIKALRIEGNKIRQWAVQMHLWSGMENGSSETLVFLQQLFAVATWN
ncbi:conserved hypothetical protein [Coccidioides posadasii str. Silveira]|uniref:Uncharacterized protein n=1 Tax=Coccidioides posadasii (strain RMSCC 757 / Silveira) TaxID=443226 RepID=E9CXD9_COCPS|nr:conserved hypothetical protein [Coccidioides posadasii str. Silveira]